MTDAGDDTVETKWVLIGNKEGEGRFVVEDGGMDVRTLDVSKRESHKGH